MTTSAQITKETAETIARFNDAFQRRDRAALAAVVHEDCLMVSAQPAPDGTAYVGKDACVAFWAELMDDGSTTFEVHHVFSDGEWAAVRWRYRFGPTDAESVLGVNVSRGQRRSRDRATRLHQDAGASAPASGVTVALRPPPTRERHDHHRRIRTRECQGSGQICRRIP
jgi:ketosteroid isomerase-like protein